jgi:hypothetical protein
MWYLSAIEAIGIDKNGDPTRENVFIATALANTIRDFPMLFSIRVLPSLASRYPIEYIEKLQSWFKKLPSELQSGVVPMFYKQDVSKIELRHINHFDLVYSRYVLDKILDDDKKKWIALSNPKYGEGCQSGRRKDSRRGIHPENCGRCYYRLQFPEFFSKGTVFTQS